MIDHIIPRIDTDLEVAVLSEVATRVQAPALRLLDGPSNGASWKFTRTRMGIYVLLQVLGCIRMYMIAGATDIQVEALGHPRPWPVGPRVSDLERWESVCASGGVGAILGELAAGG